MGYKCAICEARVYRPVRYFCWDCYALYKDEICNKVEWTRFVVSEESKRRRREKSERDHSISFVYLGDKWSIDNRGNLVYKEGYHG